MRERAVAHRRLQLGEKPAVSLLWEGDIGSPFLMEKENMSRRYETRKNTRTEQSTCKSRVDWRRTKRERVSLMLDSDDQQDSESDWEEESEDVTDSSSSSEDVQEQQQSATVVSKEDGEEEECVALGTRKRTSSVMFDSDSSSGAGPVRKVFGKRRCIIDEDECDQRDSNQHLNIKEEETSSTGEDEESFQKEEKSLRKQRRLSKLKELSEKRRSKSHGYLEDSSEEADQFPLTPDDTSDLEDDNSLKDFIVEDEKEENTEETKDQSNTEDKKPVMPKSILAQHHIPRFSCSDRFDHFQRVVKAFLINALDSSFLSSLYDGTRQKRYAQEMVTALYHLDNRSVQPRLENLIGRSRWKERYKERVECYPCVRIVLQNPSDASCQACELQRYCKYSVFLSGQSYNNRTLETDDFLPHDRQVLKVGSVCADRTRVYHQLRHFKYNLYQACISKAEQDGTQGEPVKDIVERLFSQLKTKGWIQEFDLLERYLNEADFFQEEKMD
ncbi:coiled-coil domain-containing protein 82 isoform X2 [Rhinatrema bivittatum]|uniref:coiled-coil domain-containing protein 82 isoform X2 n=1 Tax=Rhinatrema bivittatum TaxID=194408 RepID=UPI00112E3A9A|nr:coiled-coil domain-containing protein 82 isoform X2 [Rhinatrema bivittatum]